MKAFVTWLYYRFVFKPMLDEQIKLDEPQKDTFEIEYVSHNDIRIIEAQRQRKRISDGELH